MYNINQLSEKLDLETVQLRAYLTLNRQRLKPYTVKKDGVTYVTDEGLKLLASEISTIEKIEIEKDEEEQYTYKEKPFVKHNHVSEKKEDEQTMQLQLNEIEIIENEISRADDMIESLQMQIDREYQEIRRLMIDLKRKEASYLKRVMHVTNNSKGGQGV